MQHGAVLVERDDVAVRQVVGILARGCAVGEMDVELRQALPNAASAARCARTPMRVASRIMAIS